MFQAQSLKSFKKHFSETDFTYLENHYPRICQTRKNILKGLTKVPLDVLDIGAHWLHQTLLFALDGHRVTAADLSMVLDKDTIQDVANKNQINLYTYNDLSDKSALDGLQSNSFDLILFTEIIEHLTFNPVNMWKGIYRILKPGGKIIVTTPNYYYIGQTTKRLIRMFKRLGGGISVDEILSKKTMSPHWKEFSAQELTKYFQNLSSDFIVSKLIQTPSPIGTGTDLSTKRKTILLIEKLLPIFRSGLYMEITLAKKNHGIEIVPSW